MSLVGFRARNHHQQVAKRGANPLVDWRKTPRDFFDHLHCRYRFTVDAAASADNALLPRFWSVEDSGLRHDWNGERVWCNPPYSSIDPWVMKAHDTTSGLVAMLLPANRTEQKWWQRWVEPYRDRGGALSARFLPGRMRFVAHDADTIGPNERPPFGCVLLVWDRSTPLQKEPVMR